MANQDSPFGFKPIRQVGSAPESGGIGRYYRPSSDSNNLFIGDPVALGGSADTLGMAPSVVRATAGSGGLVIGVVVAVENLTSDNLSRTYLPTGVAGYVMVSDNPNQVYEVQEDSEGNALAATATGSNIDFIFGTGNTTTGISACEINSDTCDTTNTLQCRVLRLIDRPDNELGANAKWAVRFNTHSNLTTTGLSE
jgi:hypothetical protein